MKIMNIKNIAILK